MGGHSRTRGPEVREVAVRIAAEVILNLKEKDN
jgi:hypothetical protein